MSADWLQIKKENYPRNTEDKEQRRMKFLLIGLIALTPVIFWLLWSRKRHEVEPPQVRPSAGDEDATEIKSKVVDVDRLQHDQPLKVLEKEQGVPASIGAESHSHAAHGTAQSAVELTDSIEETTPPVVGTRLAVGINEGSSEQFFSAAPHGILPLVSSGATVEDGESSLNIASPRVEVELVPTAAVLFSGREQEKTNTQAPQIEREIEVCQPTSVPPSDELPEAEAEDPEAFKEDEETSAIEAKVVRRYRPPSQRPPRPTPLRPTSSESGGTAVADLVLEILVRLTFDRSGFCSLGLLLERKPELDAEVAVTYRGKAVHLMAQEDWYEDLYSDNLGDDLQHGLELKARLADDRRPRWLLSGRDIYVLASHPEASGFVSTSRLELGRSHVVLCTLGILKEVEALLNAAGCQGYTKFDESHNLPIGWAGLRGVLPTSAIPLEVGSDPFYAIKPAPDINIAFEGGVRLRNSVWLSGYPPQIKLLGQTDGTVKVLIDGKEAQCTDTGSFLVPGYELPGEHSVYCESLSCSRSYSIEEPPDSWLEWPAYHYGQADICGPLVRVAPGVATRPSITVPMSNPLLLGAEPGQVFHCSFRNVPLWKGYVPFDVVWALPAQPLICDKRTARILQFADLPVSAPGAYTRRVVSWRDAILDASRKGLQIENGSPGSATRWREYKKAARNMWRSSR